MLAFTTSLYDDFCTRSLSIDKGAFNQADYAIGLRLVGLADGRITMLDGMQHGARAGRQTSRNGSSRRRHPEIPAICEHHDPSSRQQQ